MSEARARVMREAGERFDREQAAADKRASEQAAAVRNAQFLGKHPQLRNLAGLTGADIKKTPAGAAGGMHGRPAGRGAKVVSKAGGNTPGGGGKITGPASSSAPRSRWAHFANVSLPTPRPAPSPAMSGAVGPDLSTPERVAAFVAASAAKCRPAGAHHTASVQRAAPKPAALVKHDMSTPDGVAAFVAASAAKARGARA